MDGNDAFTIFVDPPGSGKRLDAVIAEHLPDCSRSLINSLIRDKKIRVNGVLKKPGYHVREGDEIHGAIPPPQELDCEPEPIEIDILFEDEQILVLNKQAGIVVHPAPGNPSGTLVNALLYHCPDLGGIGNIIRPGIVHRLDKDTTGTLVVAKTATAHHHLSEQFKARKVQKSYAALVYGHPKTDSGVIDLPIGRHPSDRKRMSTVTRVGREALTLWQVTEQFDGAALLKVEIKTGRTHQIRVHCAAEGHPLVGDPVYGRKKSANPRCRDLLQSAHRQMLHALRLRFTHPLTGADMTFDAPLPTDMAALLQSLRSHCGGT